jgi:hypothetical protein
MTLSDWQIQHQPSGYIMGGIGGDTSIVSVKGIRSSGNLRGQDEANSYHDGDLPGLDFSGGRSVTLQLGISRTVAGTEATVDSLGTVFQRVRNPKDRQLTASGYLYNYAFGSSATPNSYLVMKLPWRTAQVLMIGRPGKYDIPLDILYSYGSVTVTGEWKIPDGLLYDPNVVTASVGLASPTAGIRFPWTFPITFGTSAGANFTLTNGGKTDGPVCFKVSGQCTNPRIVNQTTGAFCEVDVTMVAGDNLWIDMQHGLVYLNGVVRNNVLRTGSTFWDLPPGQTVIQFSSSDGSQAGGTLYGYALSAWQAV